MIPKTIHYCWFGGNPKPALAKKCIKSWKQYCRGYEIIEWNEDNFSIADAPLYVRQAYESKKWAFVTDYVRLYAMVNYGGIYMDTDVEVIKPIDKFLSHEAFSGFEAKERIPTGIMASEKGFDLFRELMREYENVLFIREDGSMDTTTNVSRITQKCNSLGFVPNGQFQIINGLALYPMDYFCPKSYKTNKLNITDNTHTIHWFSGSWKSREEKEAYYKYLKKEKINQFKMRIKGYLHIK